MTGTLTIAISMAQALIQLRHTIRVGAREHLPSGSRLRWRLRTLVPLSLALIIVALATVGYLELVGTVLASLE
ncbi:hypothetical protein [Natronolimnobius baerhuensis]|uniref:Uncharacterized protein n=1 Tax=Natronolimnobius baerhuensis TaxID=253108 RepID=A0A202E698_9EURY|nr:hypothetical protein [Natronolimnobius baerhuensis]OVE83802.1 hypothetical protein B2G88_15385 [Natronolimnobius baerhuensis]